MTLICSCFYDIVLLAITVGCLSTRHIRVPDDPDEQCTQVPFHTLITCDGSVYEQWQSRLAYYWFKQQRAKDSCREMDGFTRVLHSGKADAFMEEIPSVVVPRLNAAEEMGYMGSDRPFAIKQLLRDGGIDISEDYILLLEPDHFLTRPVPNLAVQKQSPVAFDFWYMHGEGHPESAALVRRHCPRCPETVQPLGPSPVIASKETFHDLAPRWLELSIALRKDSDADAGITAAGAANNWVSEMWAYSMAAAEANVTHDLLPLMWELNGLPAQGKPPSYNDTFMFHYAFPMYLDNSGSYLGDEAEAVWVFDKHEYRSQYPLSPIPALPSGAGDAEHHFVSMLNEAEGSFGTSWPRKHRASFLAAVSAAVNGNKALQS